MVIFYDTLILPSFLFSKDSDDKDKINNIINNRLSCITLSGSSIDLNDLKGHSYYSGFYEIQTNVPNSPVEWCLLLVIANAGAIQVIFKSQYIYMRMYTGIPITWLPWYRIELELF